MPLALWLDVLVVAVLGALGVYAFVESWNIRPGFGQVLGADAYPRIVAGVLVVLCAAYIASIALQAWRQRGEAAADPQSIPLLEDWRKARWLLLQLWVALLAYIVVVPVLGYFLASFLYLIVAIFCLGYREDGLAWLWRALAYAGVILLMLWLLLDRLLGVFLPSGIWA